MKKYQNLKTIINLLFIGVPLLCFSQNTQKVKESEQIKEVKIEEEEEVKEVKEVKIEEIEEIKEIKEIKETKKTEVKEFSLTLELNKNWKIKNSYLPKTLVVKNDILKSTFKIESANFKKTQEKIFGTEEYKSVGTNFDKLYNLKAGDNAKISMKFSITNSQLKENSEIITIDKIINKKAYTIKATITKNCSKCKEEFESIVDSMEQL